MRENLEHKIANAIWKHDQNVRFENKSNLWKRLATVKYRDGFVPVFWKVAAIILLVLFSGSIWGAFYLGIKIRKDFEDTRQENANLHIEIDSILSIPNKTDTVYLVLEKEKVVYRSSRVQKNETARLREIENLNSKNKELMAGIDSLIFFYKQKIDSLANELVVTQNLVIRQGEGQEPVKAPFVLKSTLAGNMVQRPLPVEKPDLKLKILNNSGNSKQYDFSSTLFKKQP